VHGRHLRQVERHRGRSGAHPEAQQDASDDHDRDIGRQPATKCPYQEQARADQQASLAAKGVGKLPAKQGTERRAGEEQHADHERLRKTGEMEIVPHVEQGTRYHARVVAEEQPTERGDDGELDKVTTAPARSGAGIANGFGCAVGHDASFPR